MKDLFKVILGAIIGAVLVLVLVFVIAPIHDKYASGSFNNTNIDIVPNCSASTIYVCVENNAASNTLRQDCKRWCETNMPNLPNAVNSCRDGCGKYYVLFWEKTKTISQ